MCLRLREVERDLEHDAGVADAGSLRDESLQRLERGGRVAALERAARELGLGEERERREAGRAQHAPRVHEHARRFVELAPADEKLAEVRACDGRVLAVAGAEAILLRAGIQRGGLVPAPSA